MQQEILAFINEFIKENNDFDRDITENDNLKTDIGLDSLGVLTLADALEEEYEISIEFEDLTQAPQIVKDLVDLIAQKRKGEE